MKKTMSRGMLHLEGIFLEYEAEIEELLEENARLREDRGKWMDLAMQGVASREASMLEMISKGIIQNPKTKNSDG